MLMARTRRDGSMSYSTNSRAGAEPDDNLSGDISFSSDENDVASGGGGGAQSGSDAFANTLRCGNVSYSWGWRTGLFAHSCGAVRVGGRSAQPVLRR